MATNNQLASAVATILPNEDLAKIDVYKEKAAGIVNSIQDQLNAFGVDLGAIIRGGASVASLLPSIVDKAGKLSEGAILERLAAASDITKSVFNKLPLETIGTATEYLKQSQDLIVSVQGVVKLAQNTDFSNVRALGEFVNKVYGSDIVGFTDPNSKAGVMIGLIGDCQKAGFGNVFNQMTEQLKGDVLNKVAAGCVEIGIKESDITLLRDISDKMGDGFIKQVSPNVLKDFASNFKLKETINPESISTTFSTIIETFDKIDENWLLADRPEGFTERVLDAKAVVNASPDFLEVMMNNVIKPIGETVIDIGNVVATTVIEQVYSPKEALKKQFPRLVIGKEDRSGASTGAVAFPVPV